MFLSNYLDSISVNTKQQKKLSRPQEVSYPWLRVHDVSIIERIPNVTNDVDITPKPGIEIDRREMNTVPFIG